MNPKVDRYLSQVDRWREELTELRRILLDSSLIEELKWGVPCYQFRGNKVAIIGGLKNYCVLSFFKGILLQDPEGLLSKPGENTQGVRVIRFVCVRDILDREPVLKAYIFEAIELERVGLKVKLKKPEEHKVPDEFQNKLKQNPALKKAFGSLSPGRQRAYLLHFAAPKQSRTRESRIEKYIPQILRGKGLNDL